ncbi:V-type ATP synthase subunit E [Murdochiella vaginalis]|uniref:V-type ATP synthase subunit E n=1 Tax=Murdochiella vaginalis TaxID=1852373 RepID=UPI0008FDAFFC|nr:hypothetical protein [Murdochiella vaginalis]
MVELQSKLALFRNMIWSEEKRRSEQMLYDSTTQNSKLIEERKARLKRESEQYIEQHVDRAKREAREQLVVHRQENQRVFLETQKKCLDALNASIRQKFADFAQTPEYAAWMKKHLRAALEEMDVAEVHVLDRDQDLAHEICGEDLPIKSMPEEEIGGFVLVDRQQAKRTRHTFQYLIQDNEYEIGRALNDWLMNGAIQEAEGEAHE